MATLDTGAFWFTTFGTDRADALSTMEKVWAAHCEEYAGRVRYTWDEVRDEVSCVDVGAGCALRDGEPIWIEAAASLQAP